MEDYREYNDKELLGMLLGDGGESYELMGGVEEMFKKTWEDLTMILWFSLLI